MGSCSNALYRLDAPLSLHRQPGPARCCPDSGDMYMIIRLFHLVVVVALLSGAPLLRAAETGPGTAVAGAHAEKLRTALERPEMGLSVETIEVSEVPGLYAVQYANGPLVYATENGAHFIVGDLHRVTPEGLVNVTELRRDRQRTSLLGAVDEKDMIVFAPEGEPRARISVFTDTTCFYCQKLHREVPALNEQGVEVRYLAWPRGGPVSDGYRQLVTAWCANDRQQTLTRLKARQSVPEKLCADNPIDEQFQLGQQVGVRGTPALVTDDGRLIPGYQPADQLLQTLGLQ